MALNPPSGGRVSFRRMKLRHVLHWNQEKVLLETRYRIHVTILTCSKQDRRHNFILVRREKKKEAIKTSIHYMLATEIQGIQRFKEFTPSRVARAKLMYVGLYIHSLIFTGLTFALAVALVREIIQSRTMQTYSCHQYTVTVSGYPLSRFLTVQQFLLSKAQKFPILPQFWLEAYSQRFSSNTQKQYEKLNSVSIAFYRDLQA